MWGRQAQTPDGIKGQVGELFATPLISISVIEYLPDQQYRMAGQVIT